MNARGTHQCEADVPCSVDPSETVRCPRDRASWVHAARRYLCDPCRAADLEARTPHCPHAPDGPACAWCREQLGLPSASPKTAERIDGGAARGPAHAPPAFAGYDPVAIVAASLESAHAGADDEQHAFIPGAMGLPCTACGGAYDDPRHAADRHARRTRYARPSGEHPPPPPPMPDMGPLAVRAFNREVLFAALRAVKMADVSARQTGRRLGCITVAREAIEGALRNVDAEDAMARVAAAPKCKDTVGGPNWTLQRACGKPATRRGADGYALCDEHSTPEQAEFPDAGLLREAIRLAALEGW